MLHTDEEKTEEKITVAERMSAFVELCNTCKRTYEGQLAELLIQNLIFTVLHAKASFIKKYSENALTDDDIQTFKTALGYTPGKHDKLNSENDLFIFLADAYSLHNSSFLLKTFYLKYQESLRCYSRSRWSKNNLSWEPVINHAIHSQTLFCNNNRTKETLMDMGIIDSNNQLLTEKYSALSQAYKTVQKKKAGR